MAQPFSFARPAATGPLLPLCCTCAWFMAWLGLAETYYFGILMVSDSEVTKKQIGGALLVPSRNPRAVLKHLWRKSDHARRTSKLQPVQPFLFMHGLCKCIFLGSAVCLWHMAKGMEDVFQDTCMAHSE